MFKDKTTCVFGGTGSIGSLIVEYLLKQKPYSIRVFSNDENSLWECQQKWNNNRIRCLLGDVRNLERVRRALKGVNYAINCAAIKHVPFCEYNPMEAVSVNIMGLDNIITASIEHKIKKLLHISTDKAIEPSSLMGCSKKISERLLQVRWSQDPLIQMVCVRLGNIYGSRGSIVQIAKEKKEKKEPILLTNIDMERFFMYPKEMIDFITKAFIEGKNGEIWVPKLREQKLIDVIQEIVGKDYPIEIIGNRLGEKLHEKLISDYEILISNDVNPKYWIIPNEYEKWSEID